MRRLILLSLFPLMACSPSPGAPSPGSSGTSTTSGGSPGSGGTTSGGAATSGGASSGGATNGGTLTSGGAPANGGSTSGGATNGGGNAGSTSGGATSGGGGSAGGGAANGGTAGAAGGGGANGGSGSGGPCTAPGITFCSDFEADTLPAGLSYFPEYQRPMMSNFVSISTAAAHSGTRSVKVNGAEFSQMLATATPAATFWGRVYLRSETDIQMGHNTYVAATDGNGDPNNGEHIRIGEHQCQLEVNRKTDDAEKLSNGGMYSCTGGIKLVANTWYCLEFFYDGPASALKVFVDRDEVTALNVTNWGPYQYKLFKFGFEKYHGQSKVLYYDDVALGTQRIGCF